MNEKSLELNSSKQKAPRLNFDRCPQSNLFTTKQK